MFNKKNSNWFRKTMVFMICFANCLCSTPMVYGQIIDSSQALDAKLDAKQKIGTNQDSTEATRSDVRNLDYQIEYKLSETEAELQLSQENVQLQKIIRNILLGLAVILLFLLYLFYHRFRLKRKVMENEVDMLKSKEEKKHLEVEHLKMMQSLELLEKQRLQEQLQQKERSLVANMIHINQKNKILEEIKEIIEPFTKNSSLEALKKLQQIAKIVEANINQKDNWEKFQSHFEEVHPLFFEKLQTQYPDLKKNDLRLCAYFRMNLSNKEIAQIMSIDANSVGKARYRIRKKMKLDRTENLDHVIHLI